MDTKKKQVIDLTGPEGNAFVLFGYAKKYSKQLGLDYNKVRYEMGRTGYDNLIRVFEKYFGEHVTLLK